MNPAIVIAILFALWLIPGVLTSLILTYLYGKKSDMSDEDAIRKAVSGGFIWPIIWVVGFFVWVHGKGRRNKAKAEPAPVPEPEPTDPSPYEPRRPRRRAAGTIL